MKAGFLNPAMLIFGMILVFSETGNAQERSYEMLPAPDLWYNDVDGIRVGARVLGQQPGTFGDGPHRIDAGIWLGTWIPEHPVSYYVSFTEPIPSISDFNSEGNVQLVSSIRAGLSVQKIVFNKRWQPGFDELDYIEFAFEAGAQKRFDKMYTTFPGLWQDEWLGLVRSTLMHRAGRESLMAASLTANLAGNAPAFLNASGEMQRTVPLGNGFALRSRLFIGVATDDTPPEFMFTHSLKSSAGWVDRGLTRAKGTIPVPWMESGLFQVAGGANLRGYTRQDINAIIDGNPLLFHSIGSMNAEVDYPNPIDRSIDRISIVGSLLDLRSYLFFDIGTSLGLTEVEETRTLANAGLGFAFSLNIPDYLGKPRGFILRYDIPLWLSHPGGGDRVAYRNIIGIGGIFSL